MRKDVKILILDDSEEDIKRTIQFLAENEYTFPPVVAHDRETFIEHLKAYGPNVIISEHQLSDLNSLQALNITKEICPNALFVLLSSQVTDEFAFELLKEGINIYILKDRMLQLPQAIEVNLRMREYDEEAKQLMESNRALQAAYKEIETKNESITQSIVFAKRIQALTLPKIDLLLKNFQEAFILYKPKDIVSGDFYWFHSGNGSGRFLVAVGDCTGHGVSGALLSMIGYNLLNDIVMDEDNLTNPTEILTQLDNSMCKLLKQDTSLGCGYHDGIDMSFVNIDKKNKKIYFCGCRRPLLYLVRNEKKVIVYKGDPYLVGGVSERVIKTFRTQEIDYLDGDIIYMLTDGYTDQFGGKDNKKFMKDEFIKILMQIQHLNLNYQSQLLEQKLIRWQGDLEQTDDILVVGIKL